MSNSIIEVNNLSKSYTISHEPVPIKSGGRERYTALPKAYRKDRYRSGQVRDVMAQKAMKLFSFPKSLTSTLTSSTTKEEFWALKDVSFKIEQGDRVGIGPCSTSYF